MDLLFLVKTEVLNPRALDLSRTLVAANLLLSKELVFEDLMGVQSIVRGVFKSLGNQVQQMRVDISQDLIELPRLIDLRKSLDVSDLLRPLLGGSSQDLNDFGNLIHLVLPIEQRLQHNQLCNYTAESPNVHFLIILHGPEEQFWRTIPSGGDVLCEDFVIDVGDECHVGNSNGALGVNEDVLRLQISMHQPHTMQIGET